jgi:hypothetical protein
MMKTYLGENPDSAEAIVLMIYFQGNTPLKVSIILNIGATEVSPLLCTYL